MLFLSIKKFTVNFKIIIIEIWFIEGTQMLDK